MELDNSGKAFHGYSAIESLGELLCMCEAMGCIRRAAQPYRIGYPGYSNGTQFYAPYLIEFNDGSMWIIFSTTSLRSDRIKEQQWDSYHLKMLNNNIKRVYLTYPNAISEKEERAFIRQNNKYKNHEEYSVIDAIISQSELVSLIENYALSQLDTGRVKDRLGNNFEVRIAAVLSSKMNFAKWMECSPILEGVEYDKYVQILNALDIYPNSSITSINATADKSIIGKLPSGGNPKTDVLITVKYIDGLGLPPKHYTLSCKRSTADKVSVHEYNAQAFSNVLNPNDENLLFWLSQFQAHPTLSSLGETGVDELSKAIAPYIHKLAMWVLGGYGGSVNAGIQFAQYLLIYDGNNGVCGLHSTADYCNIIIDNCHGNFGTPFTWTYASKKRGKTIQLKCKIIK